jgi:hypothetical protein
MIQRLAIQYNKAIAYILFLSFYISCITPLYAAGKMNYPPIGKVYRPTAYYNNNTIPVLSPANNPVFNAGYPIAVPALNNIISNNSLTAEMPDINAGESADFIGGPSQPEMSAFKSAGTNDMVNLFTGDFSYNIPLLDVGGYPVNIFYNGGITMEQEASWVGLGWNINPGTVNRNMRGVPDDFDGTEKIEQGQNIKPNVTWGGRLGADVEGLGIKDMIGFSVGAGIGYSHNSYLGPALDAGIKGGISLKVANIVGHEKKATGGKGADTAFGSVEVKLSVSADVNSRTGLTINPNISLGLKFAFTGNTIGLGFGASTSYNSRTGIKSLNLYEQASFSRAESKKEAVSYGASTHGSTISFAKPSYLPVIRMPITNTANSGHFQIGGSMFGAEASAEVEVYKQQSKVADSDTLQVKPMIGYIYAHKANNNPDAIMDFSRFNDKEVTPKTTIISVPQYAYDVFSINGEGTGGSIRAYRNDYGYVRDNRVRSKDKSISFGVDVGVPGQIGANFNTIKTPTTSGDWEQGNRLRNTIAFTEKSELEEHVYFRNPGETSVLNEEQYKRIGGTDIVRYKLSGENSNPAVNPVLERFNEEGKKIGEQNMLEPVTASGRNKRTQVISFLTATEASTIGLDSKIRNYDATTIVAGDTLKYASMDRADGTYRRNHHISEINVTENDGKRYVYGLPVYNLYQKDYTTTVTAAPDADDLVTVSNDQLKLGQSFPSNRDGYILTSATPAYAHSYLLTGLLSPDYVDITGNGITEDDLGTAVKFNYTKMAAKHKWRTPYNSPTGSVFKAHFNDGNMSETKDDKGVISYGERESWYVHSIESKTMVAFFHLEGRKDGKGVKGLMDNMDLNDASMKRLQKITLYNKADIRKNGLANAKPIKTVWFEYDYSLCSNAPNNNGDEEMREGINQNAAKGKLTLKGIYFTYNGQARANKNKYVFNYAASPSYALNASDRWGNYKLKSQNPQGLKNSIYPYSLQDNQTTIHANAAAWSLNKILLPSGGQLEVTYESDDYAYVQDRRATVMMSLAYLGTATSTDINNNRLYELPSNGPIVENDRVYINVPEACSTKQEVGDKYLQGINQLAFKLAVNMPKKKEFLTVYTSIENFGPVAGQNLIWIQLKKVNNYSPLSLTAIEYLREHLPGQAYTGHAPEGDDVEKFGKAIKGLIEGMLGAYKDPVDFLRQKNKAQTIVLAESFVRLNVPLGSNKYGGGHRVKSVVIKDNWNRMTNQFTATYGQQYDYITTEIFNGVTKTISSGVASYEPSIGGEENPFQEIVQIANKLPLGPATYEAIEMPVLDAFFPSPMVGYSKVTVKSIKSGTAPANGKKTRSGTGKQVTEFFTARDYPVIHDHTRIDPDSDKQDNGASLFGFFRKWSFESRAISQGFRVILNDMHGKTKSQSAYAETDPDTRISYTKYYYRNTGEKGLTEKFDFAHQKLGGEIKEGNMGIDIELMTDTREFAVKSNSINVQAQVDWMVPAPIPVWLPFIWPTFGKTESYYRAVTTTKVINYHSIVDSVVTIDKGSSVTTRNLVYDAETGNVIVSRTNNEFDRPVYQTSYPAYWAYSGMGPAYKNIDARFNTVNFEDGKIMSGITVATQKEAFESGDELYIISGAKPTTGCAKDLTSSDSRKIWVMDKNKNNSSLTNPAPDFIFIDEKGVPYTRSNVSLRIVRSGKRNMLGAQLQSFTSLLNPEAWVSDKRKLQFDHLTQVVNTSAIEYKEKWQTDKDGVKRYRQEPIPMGSELITNGDFSSGNTGFSSEYTYYTSSYSSGGEGRYTVRNSSGGWQTASAPCSDHTSGTGNMMVVNGHTTANRVLWSKTVGITPNKDYAFSFWAQSVHTSNRAILKVLINDIQIGDPLSLGDVCQWRNYIGYLPGSGTSTVTIKIINAQLTAGGNDFAIDDISFKQVDCGFTEEEDCDGYLEQQINPYRKGLLGTYRSHRSMLFYGERKQGQNSLATDTKIDKDGALKEFLPYWDFNIHNNLTATTDVKWVWNSEVTRFNSRGLELETKDALGVYTAAQYGYAKNLPIAISNNARYQEMAYTNFEDADYKESLNKMNVETCINNQHFYFDKNAIVNNEIAGFNAHSGKGMIRVNASSSLTANAKVFNENLLGFDMEYLQITDKALTDYGYLRNDQTVFTQPVGYPAYTYTSSNSENLSDIRASISRKSLQDQYSEGAITIVLDAYFRISRSGSYKLYDINSGTVNGQWYQERRECDPLIFHEPNGSANVSSSIIQVYDMNNALVYGGGATDELYLYKGIYKITKTIVCAFELEEGFHQSLDGCGGAAGDYGYLVGSDVLFTFRHGIEKLCWSDENGIFKSLTTETGCTYTKPIQGDESMMNPIFQMPGNKKMLLSAWVREQTVGANYNNGQIQLIFKDVNGAQIGSPQSFTASGPVIEGWQKIEDHFTAPAGAVTVEVVLANTGNSGAVYFDDIRIHPYEANMKSFVYDPVNLRLLAELDANNYATFYEYDEEGGLIRTKAETYEGVKTIKETRSANQKQITTFQ